MKQAKLTGSGDGRYTTAEVVEALFSDLAYERTALVRAQREAQELLVKQMRGELLDRSELTRELTSLFVAVNSTIQHSQLESRDKQDIYREIQSLPQKLGWATCNSQWLAGIKISSQTDLD